MRRTRQKFRNRSSINNDSDRRLQLCMVDVAADELTLTSGTKWHFICLCSGAPSNFICYVVARVLLLFSEAWCIFLSHATLSGQLERRVSLYLICTIFFGMTRDRLSAQLFFRDLLELPLVHLSGRRPLVNFGSSFHFLLRHSLRLSLSPI